MRTARIVWDDNYFGGINCSFSGNWVTRANAGFMIKTCGIHFKHLRRILK